MNLPLGVVRWFHFCHHPWPVHGCLLARPHLECYWWLMAGWWFVRVPYQMRTISSHHIHVVAIYTHTSYSGLLGSTLSCSPTVDTRRKMYKNVTECTIITTEYAIPCRRRITPVADVEGGGSYLWIFSLSSSSTSFLFLGCVWLVDQQVVSQSFVGAMKARS